MAASAVSVITGRLSPSIAPHDPFHGASALARASSHCRGGGIESCGAGEISSSVNASAGRHTTSFGGKALAEDTGLVLEILADMLRRPTFPEQEVERLRTQFITSLRQQEQDTRTMAARAARWLRPADESAEHPFGPRRYLGVGLAFADIAVPTMPFIIARVNCSSPILHMDCKHRMIPILKKKLPGMGFIK